MTDLIAHSYERTEAHPVPEWVERLCADFGITESGLPKYRVMWNPDRRRPMNIINPETGNFVVRNPLRYPAVGERWILETLLPWELYGTWNEAAFGPKPADGEYCLSHIIQLHLMNMMQHPANERTEYLSLDDFGQDSLRLLLTCIEKSRALSAWQLRNFDEEMIQREEREFHDQFENVYEDNMSALREIEKLQEKSGLITSLDPIPKQIEKERRRKAREQGKNLIH
jgi:hypothetical protein